MTQRYLLRLVMWAGALMLAMPVARADQVSCTPQAGYTHCWRITYSGSDQTFNVPANVTSVFIKAWGAGGGGGPSWWADHGGGGGGFASGTLLVTGGQALGVRVGQGGVVNSSTPTYGGGGAGGSSPLAVNNGASGGGLSGVFSSTTYTQSNARLIAGGGGGMSPGSTAGVGHTGGGGGGGATGGDAALAPHSGRGGSQTAGGAAGTRTGSLCSVAGTGTALQGGAGASVTLPGNSQEGGGGGGGGYFGGGGGQCQQQRFYPNGAGGGGSGYVGSVAGAINMPGGTSTTPNVGGPTANASDLHYETGIGVGGGRNANGGNGLVVIQYSSRVSGRVFLDNGSGSGTANDGMINGNERGIPGVGLQLTNCATSTISSSTTDGNGNYTLDVPVNVANNTPLCVTQTNAPSHLSTGASIGNVPLPSGSAVSAGGTSYTYTRTNTPDLIAFNWNGSGHADLNFGDVERNVLATDGAKSGVPGSVVSYAHSFTARTRGVVRFDFSSTVTAPTLRGWNARIFADPGCTGAVRAGAQVLYPSTTPVTTTVVAGQTLCLMVQEFIPATAPDGSTTRRTVRASFDYANASPALSATYTVLDVTTVSDGVLDLKKEVRNVTQGVTTFGINNEAKPGETLEYRVTYTNNGDSPISKMTVSDKTPAFTTFLGASTGTTPATLTACAKHTPANAQPAAAVPCTAVQAAGGTGPIDWRFTGTVQPGGTGTVLFQVRVD